MSQQAHALPGENLSAPQQGLGRSPSGSYHVAPATNELEPRKY